MNTQTSNFETSGFDPQFNAGATGDGMTSTGALRRAIWALALGGIGAILMLAVLTFSAFDPTGDTAGITASTANLLGRPGANLSNFFLQLLGWGALPLAGLMVFAAARSVLKS